MDFGRLTLAESVVLYLFGTPGQDRYWFMWDDVVNGAIGGIVLVDTRRLADSFSAVDFLEDRGMPIVIAVNCFDGVMAYTASDIRDALAVPSRVPIVFCDARDRETVRRSLVTLVELALAGSERPARPRRAVPRRERHGAGRRPTAGSRFGRPF
jgi:signal recognition particle receptor subunit beta